MKKLLPSKMTLKNWFSMVYPRHLLDKYERSKAILKAAKEN